MRYWFTIFLFCMILLVPFRGHAKAIDDLILMTENFPPYNFSENGKPSGISVDLMEQLLIKVGSKLSRNDIKIMPWARSYRALQSEPSTVLFVVTRTSARENLFKWVGPVTMAKNVLLASHESEITQLSLPLPKDLKYGALRDDAAGQLLSLLPGFNKQSFSSVSSVKSGINMLLYNRFDLFAYDANVVSWIMKDMEISQNNVKTVYSFEPGEHYFAFHKSTPDSLIRKFQDALDQLKASGEFDKILNRYLN